MVQRFVTYEVKKFNQEENFVEVKDHCHYT